MYRNKTLSLTTFVAAISAFNLLSSLSGTDYSALINNIQAMAGAASIEIPIPEVSVPILILKKVL
jgi:hypothetical protein